MIQRSLVWEGHFVRESYYYLSTWECVYPLLISSLGFICLCSGYVYLYICIKKNKHMCVCVVFSIIEHVYWYLRVILSSMFVVESSYVSFLRSYFLCTHFVIFLWEWDEWPFPRALESLSFLSLYSLLMWLHSMFDLSWSSLFFVYSLFHYHPCHCLWFIPFASPPCYFLTLTYSRFDISLASFLCISLLVWFASLSHYWYYIHIGHPQVHGSQAFLCMLHFIHEGIGFLSLGIWA